MPLLCANDMPTWGRVGGSTLADAQLRCCFVAHTGRGGGAAAIDPHLGKGEADRYRLQAGVMAAGRGTALMIAPRDAVLATFTAGSLSQGVTKTSTT
jgi:hypothetical protein